MKQSRVHLVIFFVFLVVCVVCIQFKKSLVTEEKSKPVESILSLLQAEGIPIETQTLKPTEFFVSQMATLKKCGKETLCTYVSAESRRAVHPGQKVYQSGSEKQVGLVKSVSRRQNYSNGLYQVVVTARSEFRNMKQEFVVAEVIVQSFSKVLSVPQAAVLQEGGKFYVWKIVEESDSLEKSEVKIAAENSRAKLISQGLTIGDRIVVRGNRQLVEGAKFQIVKSSVDDDDTAKAKN